MQKFTAAFTNRPDTLLAIILSTVSPHYDPTGKYLGRAFEPYAATPLGRLALRRIPLERHRTSYALRAVQAISL
jgi:hypothetical protein